MSDAYIDWKGWSGAEFARFSNLDACYFEWHVERALGRRPEAWRVLELGFGNGRFMGWAAGRGADVVGIEVNPRLVALARSCGLRAETSLDALPVEERFDLVAGFDVLEHVPRDALGPLLGQLASRLRPDGALIFRFPNAESPVGLHLQHGDLTHVNAIGASAMKQLAGQIDLTLAHTGDQIPWHSYPGSRRVGALAQSLLRRGLEWLVRKAYRVGRNVDLAPNQTVVLRASEAIRAAEATASSNVVRTRSAL